MKHHKLFLTLILSFLAFQNLFAQQMQLIESCVSGSNHSYSISATASYNLYSGNYRWSVFQDGIEISTVNTKSKTFTYEVDLDQLGSGTYMLRAVYLKKSGFIPKVVQELSSTTNLFKTDFVMQGRLDVDLQLCASDVHFVGGDSLLIMINDPAILSSSVEIYPTDGNGQAPIGNTVFTDSRPNNHNTYLVFGNVFTPGNYYYIKLTVNKKCLGTIEIVKYLYLKPNCRKGNNLSSNESINYVYPNPVQDYLNFNDDASSVEKVIITDITGANVKTFINPSLNTIDLSNLEAGFYNVTFYKTNGEVIVKKVSKQ